jgi:pyrroloquinoline quinone biosynthesis protein D
MMDGPVNGESAIRLAATYRFQWEEAQQAYVLLYPEGMIKLNGPAGEILKRCDGSLTEAQLIEALHQQFPGNSDLEHDVRAFLSDARARGWIRDD